MGGMGIFWEARPDLKRKPCKAHVVGNAYFNPERSGAHCIMQNKQQNVSKEPGVVQSRSHRSETWNKWRQMSCGVIIQPGALLLDLAFGLKSPTVDDSLLVALYLCPIQYFITRGVNRLNWSDGWFVLMKHHIVHRVRTAKGQRLFLILSIDWKDWSKQQGVLQKAMGEKYAGRKRKRSSDKMKKKNWKRSGYFIGNLCGSGGWNEGNQKMRAKRGTGEECEACREMQQTGEGDTNWGVCSVGSKGIFSVSFSWIEKKRTDVRHVCVGVKSILFLYVRNLSVLIQKPEPKKWGS